MIPISDENPTRSVPYINYALIALNVLVFIWQISLGPSGQTALYQMGQMP